MGSEKSQGWSERLLGRALRSAVACLPFPKESAEITLQWPAEPLNSELQGLTQKEVSLASVSKCPKARPALSRDRQSCYPEKRTSQATQGSLAQDGSSSRFVLGAGGEQKA